MPSLLEVCGFSYFYGGFLVGPQFTLRSYQKLVAGELSDCPGKPPNRYGRKEKYGVLKMSRKTVAVCLISIKRGRLRCLHSPAVNLIISHLHCVSFSHSVLPATKRFALGFLCLVIYAIFSPYYPDSYFLTDEYDVRTTKCSKIIFVCSSVFKVRPGIVSKI